jgi:phenylacetate-CoA ligase
MEEVLRTLRTFLGASMRIEVEYVDEIPLIRTGKRLAAVSRLGIDLQSGSEGSALGTKPQT